MLPRERKISYLSTLAATSLPDRRVLALFMYKHLEQVSSLSSSIDNKNRSVEMIVCSGQPNDALKNPCLETSEEHFCCCHISLLKRKYVSDLKFSWMKRIIWDLSPVVTSK